MTPHAPDTAASDASDSGLAHARMRPRRSAERGHSDHGWLNTYHTFSFADYWDPRHTSFGSVRVLNEDRVAPGTGFPTHPHRDAEIFSYIISGELTHRDSMVQEGGRDQVEQVPGAGTTTAATPSSRHDFYRMHRGDVQFTTGGTGIAHSEQNEADGWVHFLQIWALPWKRGLTPRYHTRSFQEDDKRRRFVPILSPLKAGIHASEPEEAEAKPSVEGTIPIHADLLFAAAILPPGEVRTWSIGGALVETGVVSKAEGRRLYLHLAMTGGSSGKARVRIHGKDELREGDGMYIENLNSGDKLSVESTGSTEAEVVLLDTA